MPNVNENRAVFLDRDGTINEEVGYLRDLRNLVILPGAAAAIRLINESGMKAVVVTNQAGVARGYFSEEFVREAHDRISGMLAAEGAFIDGFYFCPHHPTDGTGIYLNACTCRKPLPGMLLKAAEDFHIDLRRSYLIGDTLRDMEAAVSVGTTGILVRTGYGAAAADSIADGSATGPAAAPAYVADGILDAVHWIMNDYRR